MEIIRQINNALKRNEIKMKPTSPTLGTAGLGTRCTRLSLLLPPLTQPTCARVADITAEMNFPLKRVLTGWMD